MTQRTTTRPVRKGRRGTQVSLLIFFVLAAGVLIYMHPWSSSAPQDEAVEIAPATLPTERQLRIETIFPPLSEEQQWNVILVDMVLADPAPFVGRWIPNPEPISLSENELAFVKAMALRESSLVHFDEAGWAKDSGIDCDGILQICNDPNICPPDLRWIPTVNIYCGARYFRNLNLVYDDFWMALAHYQGARKADETGALTIPDPDNPDIQLIAQYLRIR